MPPIVESIARAFFSERSSLGLVPVLGDLDAARLAPAADVNLGLDDARVADFLRCGDRVFDRFGVLPRGHGDAVLGEELFSLVFEKVQERGAGYTAELADGTPEAERHQVGNH
jgi:hypothetical protein